MYSYTKALIREVSIGIAFYEAVLILISLVVCPKLGYEVLPVITGLLFGLTADILMLIHIGNITELALDSNDANYARNKTIFHSVLRKLVLVAAMVVAWQKLHVSLVAMIVGLMGMKAGAYLQPLVHRLIAGKDSDKSEAESCALTGDSQDNDNNAQTEEAEDDLEDNLGEIDEWFAQQKWARRYVDQDFTSRSKK